MASAVAQRVVLDGSRSLSTLLQKRSEVLAAARRRSAGQRSRLLQAEESDLPDIDAVDKENPLAVCEVRTRAATVSCGRAHPFPRST